MPRFGNFKVLLLSLALLSAFALTINAQERERAQVVVPTTHQEQRIADKTRLYCAGYIRNQTMPHMPEIVGGLEEQEQRRFADGDDRPFERHRRNGDLDVPRRRRGPPTVGCRWHSA